MAASSFRFVSPGVFVQEIDNSQLPATSNLVGPTVIGRFEKGPAMRPVYINSFSQFVEVFGNPIPGNSGDDVWRDGNYIGPTYAAYAAQAWLRNTPALNVIRLLGTQHESAQNSGKAGWETVNSFGATDLSGGAYGLFVMPSASAGTAVTGTLAAIFYLQQGSITLTGTIAGGSAVSGTNVVVASNPNTTYAEFKAVITNPNGTTTTSFNLNPDSNKYIRKVLNTNPILTNTSITTTANLEYYWVGETYERSVEEVIKGQTGGYTMISPMYGFIAPLTNNSTLSLDKFRAPSRPSKTGWVIGQDLTTNTSSYDASAQQKLFRIVALESGEYEQKNYKISISDIKAPLTDFEDYGAFTVDIRLASDSDSRPVFIERFANVNLNPASPDYIARRIGDKFVQWDETEKRLREYGNYTNASKFVRVEMNDDVDAGAIDPTYLPFGFFGPPRFKSFVISSSATGVDATQVPTAPVYYGKVRAADPSKFLACSASITASIVFPSIPLRISASAGGLNDPRNAYFGITTGEYTATSVFDPTYYDLTRGFSNTVGASTNDYDWGGQSYGEWSFVFSLDDVSGSAAGGVGNVYVAGSRAAGTSVTAIASAGTGSNGTDGYRAILAAGYDSFTMPLYNGFDGFKVTEAEPLRNSSISATPSEKTDHVYYTYKRAIDTIADPETIVTDIVTIPGLTNPSLTDHLIRTCENRADALAIIDLPNVYKPEAEGTAGSKAARYEGTVAQAAQGVKDRGLNSSYGATYYPWVQVRDTISNRLLFVPPSVVALGAMSYGQSSQELWFAPAGFTRGGLSEGRGGIPVLNVTHKLTSKERDTLYESKINPIAQFPAEGIVIFGQKTLQVTPSALDRINVRRMMIYVKREISRIAARLLFDQNVQVTWNRFLGQVNPFLSSVKSRLGIVEYRVILDETTTTPDLIDRNVMYAKIFLKPARAIEFIAIDFTITDSGASFND
jgi:hypothetical protein